VSDSLTKFIKLGSTTGAVNFPNLDLSFRQKSSRLSNVHLNEPGMLGQINNIISKAGANIGGQSLSTDEEIGYLIIDVDSDDVKVLAEEIKNLDKSVITRVLY
jgi:D-3-phosphoglycerate dehydrogenase